MSGRVLFHFFFCWRQCSPEDFHWIGFGLIDMSLELRITGLMAACCSRLLQWTYSRVACP